MASSDTLGNAADVFVTHASKDKAAAQKICRLLEAAGMRCWIAPRNVSPGMEWAEAIVDGIEQSSALLLVLSRHANRSPAVAGELEKAFSSGKPIFTVRVQDVKPARGIELFVRRTQWVDAFAGGLEQHIDRIAGSLRAMLEGSAAPGPVPLAARRLKRRGVIAVGGIVAACLLLAGIGGILASRREQPGGGGESAPAWQVEPVDDSQAGATLVFNITPADAAVFVDGAEAKAGTVLVVEGEHTIRVEKSGYTPHEETFSLVDGETRTLAVELTRVKPTIMW